MTATQGDTSPIQTSCWIVGGGQFGRRAAELLQKDKPAGKIIVIDKLPDRHLPAGVEVVCADGIEWFVEHFTPNAAVDRIIPALPVHLAAEWLRQKLIEEHRIVRSTEISDEQLCHFPHPMRISPSRVVMSHADFICPPNCAEPDEICTYTGKQRPPALYRILETVVINSFVPLIVRSRQFHSGVGGFLPNDLWHLLDNARPLSDTPLLIGTACKCHGIVDGLSYSIY